MRFDIYKNWSIGFYGHKYSMIELSGNRFALFSRAYNRFLDFELVNYGFTYKWIKSIQPEGIVCGENFLCYEKMKQAEDFLKKLIKKFVEQKELGVQVYVPSGEGQILKSLTSFGLKYAKDDNNGDYRILSVNDDTAAYSEVLHDCGFIGTSNYDYEDDEQSCLNIRINRKHKLNIDFKE